MGWGVTIGIRVYGCDSVDNKKKEIEMLVSMKSMIIDRTSVGISLKYGL
jgi:hypothetical protein